MAVEIRMDRVDAVIFDLDGVITDSASVHAAAWKRMLFLERLRGRGVKLDSSIGSLNRPRPSVCRTAIISASRNCVDVFEAVGVADLFDAKVDGLLRGRGGRASRGLCPVIGVDRSGHGRDLRERGADMLVGDLGAWVFAIALLFFVGATALDRWVTPAEFSQTQRRGLFAICSPVRHRNNRKQSDLIGTSRLKGEGGFPLAIAGFRLFMREAPTGIEPV